jgi:phage shock protein PspC (stress-responsive transcriptional regulator)
MIIGYIVLFIGTLTGKIDFSKEYEEEEMPRKEKAVRKEAAHEVQENGIKRLYRSGKDKILGGVCGGIAEYLQADPVIIRLIWVIFSLVYGSGILAYIIAWIIIPRNPKHKWE